MKGGMENRVVKVPADGNEDIVFKNNKTEDRSIDTKIDLFANLIIDIYLQTEHKYENGKHPNSS
jgi:hypothetical protein